ncbi:MAG: hypothetical protein J5685_04280 [Clostridiales bacterium]|nr:hypothetical protein [Clostridiales bacterium]
MEIKYRTFLLLAFSYLALPVAVFFFGFLKIGWAILFSVALIAAAFFMVRDSSEKRKIRVSPALLIGTAVFCLFWAFFAGMGEFTWTTADHTVRAAALNDLVNYDWPVFFDLSKQSNPAVLRELGGETVAFTYYFTFWMVPSLIGKIFGITAARAALGIWGALGLFILILGLFFTQKKASVSAIVICFLFGGLDILPDVYQQCFTDIGVSWEGWNNQLYIHGNLYQTMNVFHQCIAGWIATVLLFTADNRKNIGTVGSVIFCYSPWATIGAIPVAFYELLRKREGVKRTSGILSYGNLAVPVIILSVFGTFYTANIGATGDKGFIWEFIPDIRSLIPAYLLLVIIEFGIWALVVYKDEKKNGLYWVCLITLLIFPVYKMTEANDLLMRGTMVPMFVFTIFLLSKTDNVIGKVKKDRKISDVFTLGFLSLLFLMAFIPFMLMTTIVDGTICLWSGSDRTTRPKDEIVSFGDIRNEEFVDVTKRQFYVYDHEDKLFYRIFGRGQE